MMKKYEIAFVGLKNKVHHIAFEVDNTFFEEIEHCPIKKGDLNIDVFFDKKDSFFILDFQVNGTVSLACDRCLEDFDYEMIFDFKLIVKFEERDDKIGDEEDVIYLSKTETHLYLKEVIYDYILINIPIQVVHPKDKNGNDTCNPKVLEKLNVKKTEEDLDPRWAALSKLKKD
jgi:uncharacterized metal-binding protein YceD (DUF177 family)